MSNITYYLTDSFNLESIDIRQGNLLFCEDTKRIYFDNEDRRICYDSIIVFETDWDRYIYPNPIDGFYFVSETKVLWRYEDDEWVSITEPPIHNVVFIPKSELPVQGEYAVLYICGTEQYIWSPEDNRYIPMNADSLWREI